MLSGMIRQRLCLRVNALLIAQEISTSRTLTNISVGKKKHIIQLGIMRSPVDRRIIVVITKECLAQAFENEDMGNGLLNSTGIEEGEFFCVPV